MTVDDIFYHFTSQLTGGIVTDFGTLILGLVGLLAVILGFDLLTHMLNIAMSNHTAGKNFSAAETYKTMRDHSEGGSLDYDYYNAMYRSHLSKSVSVSSKTGRNFRSKDELF